MLTAAKAVTVLQSNKPYKEVHFHVENPFILHDLDGLNLSPEFDISIIIYIPANGCTCF